MNNIRQLELHLEIALEEAAEVPETVDVLGLWQQLEPELSRLSQRDQLQAAGNILMELAGICETKAEALWDDWQDSHNAEGPVMGGDWLQGITRQSQELDFSALVQRSYRTSALEALEDSDDSIAGTVDKTSALALVDALDDSDLKEQALAVSHAENVSAWINALASAAAKTSSPQRLVNVQSQLNRPLVEVWLAALLGGFTLEQRGTFYETDEIWICSGVLEAS